MSVYPTATSAPTIGGPPLVRRKIRVKLLKLKAKAPINNGEIETNSKGKVILQKDWRGVAPSTFAASNNSFGIDCNAPVTIKNMYGKPNHVLTNNTAALELPFVLNQFIGSMLNNS